MENNNKKRKKKLVTAIIIIAVLLFTALLLSEAVLPAISQRLAADKTENFTGTHIFTDESLITPEQLAGYDSCVKDIYYKKDGVEALITDGKFYEFGGNAAVMFSKYIDAIKNGDSAAYAACFSEKYDFENGLDRFASGENTFPPQRLYDIRIEQLDERYDENSGFTLGLFCVTYRIYLNTGDFRNDMTDDTAPLIFTTEEFNGDVKITDIAYRYGNN